MTILTRPILEIDLRNLLDNYRMLEKIAPHAAPAAVVKDDAYGLGAKIVAELLYTQGGCRNFFVAHAIEGERIAPLVPQAKIFVLQGIGADSLEIFQNVPQLTPVISCPEMFEFWKANRLTGRKPVIHIETGLNRLGFREHELQALSADDRGEFAMVMSHLACGDEKDHFMNAHQLENFERLKAKYFPDLPASLSASDGVFLGEKFQWDMVRLGAAMYGINTAPYRKNQMKNVVRIKAPILQIEPLAKGEFVGYSATYRASSERKIAIASIGYGDGIPRSLSNVGKIFCKTNEKLHECRIIGRMSMDNVIFDATDVDELEVGDWAYVADDFYTLDDVARDAGTISYEIMSRVGKNTRYIRNYIKD